MEDARLLGGVVVLIKGTPTSHKEKVKFMLKIVVYGA
jgi:hypothetical protein